MVTLGASPKGNPFCRPKPGATWPRKALTHFVLGKATNDQEMVGKLFPDFSIKLGFLTQNKNCLVDVFILEQTPTSGQLLSFISNRAIYLETWHGFTCARSFGLLAWDSNKIAHQFLMRIYQNFMESGISVTEIWLNFWVAASNELGKVWEEDNLVLVVKIDKGTG